MDFVDARMAWNLFQATGNPEAYLLYCSLTGVKPENPHEIWFDD